MFIKAFGESHDKKPIQFYETEDICVYCNEQMIDRLWWRWIDMPKDIRNWGMDTPTGSFTIFEFTNGINI